MRKGFTLVEVLIVIVVAAVLVGILFGMMSAVQSARITDTEGRVLLIGQSVAAFHRTQGRLPATLDELAPKTLDQPRWMDGGRFVDGWDHPIRYSVTGGAFRVWSMGPDGVSDTADDLRYKNR
jgi:prepilin-type N-terminal cleavage/methylation domain-containing protein